MDNHTTQIPWNIIGHEWAAHLLQLQIARQEVRHAYLFTGPRGVGRRTLALRFAQALNCVQPIAPGVPCGTCRLCQQTERIQLPDLSIVQAEDGEGLPDEGGILKIEQVRNLQHTLSLAPYEAKYRIAMLLRIHEANLNAQNALLKTLEEPSERVIMLLTADSVENMLPTISSRCEVLRLRPLSVDSLSQILQDRWFIPTDDACRYAHLAGGCPGLAINYQKDPVIVEEFDEAITDLMNLLGSRLKERFVYAEGITKGKDRTKTKSELRLRYKAWLLFWRDVLIAITASGVPVSYTRWHAETSRLSQQMDLDAVQDVIERTASDLEMLDANLNLQLMVESYLIDLPYFIFS